MAASENPVPVVDPMVAPAQTGSAVTPPPPDEKLTTLDKVKSFLEKNKAIIGSLGFLIALVLIIFFSFTSCHVNRVDDRQKILIKDMAVLAERVDPLTASVKDMTANYQALNGILTGIQDSNASVVKSLDGIKEVNGKKVDAVKAELTARIVKLEKDMVGIKGSVATVKTTIKNNGLETAVPGDIVTETPQEATPTVAAQEEASVNEVIGNVEIQGDGVIRAVAPPAKKMGFFRRLLPWNWGCFTSKPLELNWDNKQGVAE